MNFTFTINWFNINYIWVAYTQVAYSTIPGSSSLITTKPCTRGRELRVALDMAAKPKVWCTYSATDVAGRTGWECTMKTYHQYRCSERWPTHACMLHAKCLGCSKNFGWYANFFSVSLIWMEKCFFWQTFDFAVVPHTGDDRNTVQGGILLIGPSSGVATARFGIQCIPC